MKNWKKLLTIVGAIAIIATVSNVFGLTKSFQKEINNIEISTENNDSTLKVWLMLN